MISYFSLVNNLTNYVNYYFIIIIVPEKPLWGGSIKYVFMYVFWHINLIFFPFFSLIPYLEDKIELLLVRVGQGFWVYGIQGLFKSGIRYIAA